MVSIQEFMNYFQPTNGKQASNVVDYIHQVIEMDAITFSRDHMKDYFHLNIDL
jgi:hypothetical protein